MEIKRWIVSVGFLFLGVLALLSPAHAKEGEVLNCFFANVEGAPGLAVLRTTVGLEVRENRGGFVGGSIPRPTLKVETQKSGNECTVLLRDSQQGDVVLRAQMTVVRGPKVSGTGELTASAEEKEGGRKMHCTGDARYAPLFERCDFSSLLHPKK